MRRPSLPAFTLTELIVAMAIIAGLMGLGIQGMILIRQNTQFQQSQSNLVTILNDVRNQARNSVVGADTIQQGNLNSTALFDGLGISFDSNGYSIYRCEEAGSNSDTINCVLTSRSDVEDNTISAVDIAVYPNPDCSIIYFERLSGDIKALSGISAVPENDLRCFIRLTHTENRSLNSQIMVVVRFNSFNFFQ